MKGETIETCLFVTPSAELILIDNISGSAGAGSLILEFATLSRLTGDDRFEKAARKVIFPCNVFLVHPPKQS